MQFKTAFIRWDLSMLTLDSLTCKAYDCCVRVTYPSRLKFMDCSHSTAFAGEAKGFPCDPDLQPFDPKTGQRIAHDMLNIP